MTYGVKNANGRIYPEEVLKKYPDSSFIIISDSNDGIYNEEDDDYIYDYNFPCNSTISDLTEENGFSDVMVNEGEGFNG